MNDVILELENTLREIEKYAVSHPFEEGLPIANFKVPDAFIKLYGSSLGKEKWENFANSCYKVFRANSTVLSAEIAEAFQHIIAMFVEQLKYMYKGPNERDYVSFADAVDANNDYATHLNPPIEKTR